jgi:uncharacterized membrane-anchored protein
VQREGPAVNAHANRGALPADHPQRRLLAGEVHARPPAPVAIPGVVSCLALFDADAEQVFERVAQLAQRHEVAPPAPGGHAIVELPGLRLKCERHGEFCSLTFVRALAAPATEPFPSAFEALPTDWLAALPGRTLAAADILLLPAPPEGSEAPLLAQSFEADAMAGSLVLDGAAAIYGDFVLRDGGRTRWLVLDREGMSRARSARVVQRIAEIEIYRMAALLAYPLARQAFPELERIEQRLAQIAAATAELHLGDDSRQTQQEERRLLDQLTRIAAELEHSVAATNLRFSAGEAYWNLVQARVRELREQRIGDLRTIGGFLARRLAPAMDSCAAAERRQEELSARIERASALLRTRVDVVREEQNQQLLAAMERRSKLALRMQQTVEGLSVVVLTYYAVALVGFAVRPLRGLWPGLATDWLVAGSIPIVAYLVWRGVHRLRLRLAGG